MVQIFKNIGIGDLLMAIRQCSSLLRCCRCSMCTSAKLYSMGYHVALLHNPTLSRFDIIPECDRHTETMTAYNTLAEHHTVKPNLNLC